jgi:Mannosyl-glycoprotein endo-beta-N-acetylglucosaminidase
MSAITRTRLPLFLLLKSLVLALLILLTGTPLQAHASSSIPTTDLRYRVLGKPTVSVAFINRVLSTYSSPVAGKGQALYDDGVKYGIDPVFALAFFLQESTFGTTGVARVTHSLGNIRCTSGYPSCYHGYRMYASWEDAFLDWYRLIRDVYVTSWGLTTVDQIIPVYAPASENNVGAYVAVVKQAVDAWRAAAGYTADTSSTERVTSGTERVIIQKVTVPLTIVPSPQQQDDQDEGPTQLP